ncbi:MAG: lysostaphin resistance A-like protein [Promethearchaeota archaeon]
MVNLYKSLDAFRKKLLEKPLIAFWIIVGSFICILLITSLRKNLRALISSDLFYLFLSFIILMVIYAFYSFYFVPFVLYLPDGKQNISSFLKSLKLTKSSFSLKIIFLGLVTGILVLVGFFCTDIILGELFTFTLDFNQIIEFPNLINLGYFNFINHIAPALWEEIIFRGIMITILLKIYPVRTAIIIDGLFFGIFHIANLGPEANLFIILGQVIYTSCFGITLAYLYVKTSNLIPCIIAHYVNNILSVLISIKEVNILVLFVQACLLSLIVMILSLGIIKLFLNTKIISKKIRVVYFSFF